MPDTIPCRHCGNPFKSKRAWQKFCSAECRHAYNNGLRGVWRFSVEEIRKALANTLKRSSNGGMPESLRSRIEDFNIQVIHNLEYEIALKEQEAGGRRTKSPPQ